MPQTESAFRAPSTIETLGQFEVSFGSSQFPNPSVSQCCHLSPTMQGRFGLGHAQSSQGGTGSPCYEFDENGEADYSKPKVNTINSPTE